VDIIIVSTSNAQQEAYWQKRLTQMKSYLLKSSAHIICITEDWVGGAGNGLGTLYSYQKACEKAKSLFNLDIVKSQRAGASVSLYHTAGEGKRLYPLTGSELGNKSAVKLPGFIPGSSELISILEAVIYQTASLFPYRKGRLSVFWGDQIFMPSNPYQVSKHHIELLVKNIPLPSHEEWIKNRYDRYGFVINQQGRSNLLFEKLDARSYHSLLKTHVLTSDTEFGLSLGCFSLSHEILQAFLNLFKEELEQKKVHFDTDVHIWMPLILEEQTYLHYMVENGFSHEWAEKHYRRLQSFKQSFCKASDDSLLGTWNIGNQGHWWDYGNLNAYFNNNRELLQKNAAGQLLRQFFRWKNKANEQGSFLFNSRVASGNVKNSLLVNVDAEYLDVSNCLMINSKFNYLKADHCLLYEVIEDTPLSMDHLEVRADVKINHQHFQMHSAMNVDGKINWKILLPKNKLSYFELNQLIQNHLSISF
jgi:hypothetical protein